MKQQPFTTLATQDGGSQHGALPCAAASAARPGVVGRFGGWVHVNEDVRVERSLAAASHRLHPIRARGPGNTRYCYPARGRSAG
jgi:hypothetical protein